MHPVQRFSSIVAAVATLVIGGQAFAQTAPVIRITNANNHEIPLKAGSSVQIDSAGNLLAECALNSSTNLCTQLSTGSGTPTGAPTATLQRSDTDPEVRAGEFVRLTWSSTTAVVCNASQTGPASTLWTGPQATANASGVVVSLSTQGDYALSLQCFNSTGASTLRTVSVTVLPAQTGGTDPVPTGCDITSSDPNFQPAGWTRINKTWQVAFSSPDGDPQATYPNSVGFPVPIGSTKGTYTAIPFVPTANLTVGIFWDPVQARPADGLIARPADAMFISLSPCPGDLRASDSGASGDPWLQNGCRKFENAASIIYTTQTSSVSGEGICKLVAGRTYYLNALPANPYDGLTAGEHSCSSAPNSANGCDVQATHAP